jgi:hypothetical protein
MTGRLFNSPSCPATCWFEYGISTAYGSSTNRQYPPPYWSDVTSELTGLPESTTIHYRLVAENSGGRTYGDDATFTAAWPPGVVWGHLDAPVGPVFDGRYIFLFETYGGHLRRIELSTGVQTLLATVPCYGFGTIGADDNSVYIANLSMVYRVGKDGSNLTEFFPAADTTFILPHAAGVFVRQSRKSISKIGPDGTARTEIYACPPGAGYMGDGMTADPSYIYWGDLDLRTVNRIPVSGGAIEVLASGVAEPGDLLLDAGTLYFSTGDGIRSIPAGGGAMTAVSPARGVMTKDGSFLYLTSLYDRSVSRVDIRDGSVTAIATGVLSYDKPVVTADSIYWLEWGSRNASGYGALRRIAR